MAPTAPVGAWTVIRVIKGMGMIRERVCGMKGMVAHVCVYVKYRAVIGLIHDDGGYRGTTECEEAYSVSVGDTGHKEQLRQPTGST